MPVILAPLLVLFALIQVLWDLLKKPKYQAILIWMLIILLIGTIFYHNVEGWRWLDSLYFSVITLATVGYGDLSPTTDLSKMFTIAYIFIGFSVFVSFAGMLAQERAELHQTRTEQKKKKEQQKQ